MEHNASVRFELLDSIEGDFALLFFILLVSHKEKNHVLLRLCHHFIVPSGKIIKGLQASYVISQEYAMSSAIKYLGNRLETVLACSVPNLKLEDLLLQLHKKRSKLDAHCHLMICHEFIIRESMQ